MHTFTFLFPFLFSFGMSMDKVCWGAFFFLFLRSTVPVVFLFSQCSIRPFCFLLSCNFVFDLASVTCF